MANRLIVERAPSIHPLPIGHLPSHQEQDMGYHVISRWKRQGSLTAAYFLHNLYTSLQLSGTEQPFSQRRSAFGP